MKSFKGGKNTVEKRKKKGKVFIVIGLLLIIAALGLTGYNVYEGWKAQQASDEFVSGMDLDLNGGRVAPWYLDREMPTKKIGNYEFIGMLSIPSANLLLPVINDWSYPALSVSPCRYVGNYFHNDMVVCAHNFQKHFAVLWNIDLGEDVYFMNVEGYLFHYQVSNRETLQPTSVLEMIVNQNNIDDYLDQISGESSGGDDEETALDADSVQAEDWDLFLFTCTLGGQTRCAVRCTRVMDGTGAE